jgi:hypothetical protein
VLVTGGRSCLIRCPLLPAAALASRPRAAARDGSYPGMSRSDPGRSERSPSPPMRTWAAGGLPGLGKESDGGTFQMIEAWGLSKRYGDKAAHGAVTMRAW